MTGTPAGAGELSRLLEELAHIPRVPIPDRHFAGLAPGTAVGRFVVQREIGRGGFGVVYAAQDTELGRDVALKLLRPGISVVTAEAEWMRAEGEAVARLNHPAIVTLFEVGRSEQGAYLVFELLRGVGLDIRVARGEMTLDEVDRIAAAVTSALDQAHRAGVLHRDLKPANVFLCDDGAVKVLDFGIAHLFNREAPPGSGTPGHMAPEQRDGRPEDARSDLYALGVLIENMLAACTGTRLRGRSFRHARALSSLCTDLTQADPERRPTSAHAVLARLEAIRVDGGSRISRTMLLLSAAILAVIATWGIVEASRSREAPPGERVLVALTPTRNESGIAELDHLTEFVRTGLADSRRVTVIAQPRMEAELQALGTPTPTAAIGDWRMAADRLGASVVVDLEAGRDGPGLTVRLTGRGAGNGDVRFQVTAAAPSLDALPRQLDDALRSLRRTLGERRADLEQDSRPVSDLATFSMAAFRQYALGVRCTDSVLESGGQGALGPCGDHLRRALELDPSFALAHRDLGVVLSTSEPRSEEARRHLDTALSMPTRLSRRDGTLARAWRDHLDGNDEGALRRFASLVAEDPGDVQATFEAGDLLFHASRYEEAIPFLARLVSIDSSYPWAFSHLVECYALTGRNADLMALLKGTAAPGPAQLREVVRGYGWLGRHDRAVQLAAAWQDRLPGSSGSLLLLQALSTAGQLGEAEEVAGSIAKLEPGNWLAFMYRVLFAAERGRSRQAWRLLDAPPKELTGTPPFDLALLKASIAAGDRNLPRLRGEVQKIRGRAPDYTTLVAPQLALLGTRADVQAMRDAVPAGTTAAAEITALDVWKSGDTRRAVSMLAALDQKVPRTPDALSPAYLLAEVAREDDPSEALAAAARFRMRVPIGPAGGWTYGRSLLVSAEAAWRLGLRGEALEFLAYTDELLSDADTSYPLLLEAAQLRKAVASGAPPARGIHFGPR